MKRIEEIRILVADQDVIRTKYLGVLEHDDEIAWRRIQARLEELVREERREQSETKGEG